ncbi:MAG: FeoB-associated Cys-rich membrane protein [Cellulosilyticaceae bacterium]
MGTLIIGMVVFGAFGFVAYKTYQEKKSGKGCGGGCTGCRHANGCHIQDPQNK